MQPGRQPVAGRLSDRIRRRRRRRRRSGNELGVFGFGHGGSIEEDGRDKRGDGPERVVGVPASAGHVRQQRRRQTRIAQARLLAVGAGPPESDASVRPSQYGGLNDVGRLILRRPRTVPLPPGIRELRRLPTDTV